MIKKKSIFISGVGKGIGRDLLIKSVNEGFFVYGITRSKSDIKQFDIYKKNCKVFSGDITKISNFEKILKLSLIEKRPIVGIVNNAGIRQRKKFLQFTQKDLKNIFNINFFSIFFVIQKYYEYVKKNVLKKYNPTVINIGSIVGKRGFSELSGYASTKSAISGLTKCLALELSNENIRCNTVSPGFIKTSYFENFKKNKKLYKWTLSRTVGGKWGESKDVSNLIIFLLSNKSNFINGQEIFIDDGWTIL